MKVYIELNGVNKYVVRLLKPEGKRGVTTSFFRSEPSLAALSPFSTEKKQLSGQALSRVEPELWLT